MSEFEVALEEEETRGRFALRQPPGPDGEVKGTMTFSRAGNTLWIIDHTEVDASLKGTGAGAALVRAGVEEARRRGIRILPLCPFARSQFGRHLEYQDVLHR